MASREDLLNSLTVKQLRELAKENRVLLIYEGFWENRPARNKSEIIEILSNSRKISKKKIEDKVFGPKKSTSRRKKTTTRSKRRGLAKAEKTKILKRQKYKCANCKRDISKLAVVHYDHKTPIALGGSNTLRNFQALCPNCHAEKTQQDRLRISRARRK